MASQLSPDSSRSQTLDRGLKALKLIANSPVPMTIDEVANHLKLGRSVTYRMIRTLEDHRLVMRDASGRLAAGTQLVGLAGGVRAEMRALAAPILSHLANTLEMTSFLVVPDGEEAVTVQVAEPTSTAAHVAYRPGTRHPLNRGAPGIALLTGLDLQPSEREAVTAARTSGWAYSEGEVIEGMASIAAPVLTNDGTAQAAVAVVHLALSLNAHDVAPQVMKAANALRLKLN